MLVSLGASLDIPPVSTMWTSVDQTTTLDATTDYAAWVCRVPVTGTIDKVHARIGSTTLSGTLSCQIQTLDSSGDPSGTAYGSCTQVDVAVTGTEDNTQITFSGLACSATIDETICIRIWASTVTSGSVNMLTTGSYLAATSDALPYITTRTTGAGGGTHASIAMGPSVEYLGAVFYDVGWPPTTTFAVENIDNDGSVRRIGNRFVLPAPVTCDGWWGILDNDTDTTTVRLYDTDGTTVLASSTLVSANRQATSGRLYRIKWDDGVTVNLSANTASPYRVAITTSNTSATAANLPVANAITAAHMAMLPLGTNCYHTQHNGTSWTDTTTKRCPIGILASKIDNGAAVAPVYGG